MKKLVFSVLICLNVLYSPLWAQHIQPTDDFIRKNAFYISNAHQKSEALPDASQWISDWSNWNEINIIDKDVSYLYDFIQPTDHFQHYRIGNSPYIITVRTNSYIQHLYQRSLLKLSKNEK